MSGADHISVKRTHPVTFYHHGIDLGDGTVIHYSGEVGSKKDAQVKRSPMKDFLMDGTLETVDYHTCDPPEKVIARAMGELGKNSYNVVLNNCEHFATWCKTGSKQSDQVRNVTGKTSSIGAGAFTATSIPAVSATGVAAGLSGPGIMSGLAAIGPGGVVGGLASLAAAPAILSNVVVSKVLDDDVKLDDDERASRKAGRTAAKVGTVASAGGTLAAISATGTAAGLSGAGITSGLAAIGGTVGGGMVAGTAIAVAAPAAAAAAVGFGVYKLVKWLKK